MPRMAAPHLQLLTEKLQSYSRGFFKLSALGGDGNDQPFELAFSNLAHAFLRDKAPGLLDHEVGFQLLDRNQENTKAIGVFAFKVGSHWLYAPVFFLNGQLKGHELLYLKNQDMFVPLKESWLNYILNRKPHILGEGVSRDSRTMGVQSPDLTSITRSPTKTAAAAPTLKEMVDGVMPVFAYTATISTKKALHDLGQVVDLPSFLKEAGLEVISRLVTTCQEHPDVAVALNAFHGLNVVSDAIKVAHERRRIGQIDSVLTEKQAVAPLATLTGSVLDALRPVHPIKSGALKIINYDLTQQTEHPETMTEEDQERLLKEKLVINDDRSDDEVSTPYHIQVEQKLFTPQESGLYYVLTKTGEFERCLIIVHPLGAAGSNHFVTVIRTGDNANWVNIPGPDVWAGSRIEGDEFTEWYDGLPTAESLTKGESDYVLLGPHGQGTLPFRVTNTYGREDGSNVYEVDFETHCSGPTLGHRQRYTMPFHNDPLAYDSYRDGQRIHLNGKGGSSLRATRGDVFVPEGFKLLKVRQSGWDALPDDEQEDAEACDEEQGFKSRCDSEACNQNRRTEERCVSHARLPLYGRGSSDPPPIRPGNIIDAELAIMKKTGGLKIVHHGCSVDINGSTFAPLDALVDLVATHGLREKVARHILDTARCQRSFACRIKYASPYLTDSAPSAPSIPEPQVGGSSIMGGQIPEQMSQEQALPVTDMAAKHEDRERYNPNTSLDRRELSHIQQATQTGQREIFDTAMIGSMLKAVRDDTMVDKYLGDLTKGLDRLGRILFMFYWHGDEFAERYGKSDMPELEDSLRNAFEMLGDCIMFLKQKSIEPFPEEDQTAIDLGATANA